MPEQSPPSAPSGSSPRSPSSYSASSDSRGPIDDHGAGERRGRFNRQAAFWVLAALVFALPTLSLPNQGIWLGVKSFLLEAAGIILAVVVFSRGEWTRERVRHLLLAAPNLAIFAFLAWVGISAARSDLPEYSRYEAMRHLGGALVYFGIVYGISRRRQLPAFVSSLCLAGTIGALLAFVALNQQSGARIHGAFQNSQLLAAFLCALLPITCIASQTDSEPLRRMGAQFATVVVAAGIMVAQNRSAWAGSLVGACVLLGLYIPFVFLRQHRRLQMHQVVIPLLMIALAGGLFYHFTSQGDAVMARAQTLQLLDRDQSYQWRRGMWDKARRMANARPVFGWGIGTFPMQQALYYHPDVPTRTQLEIAVTGPTLAENAHNTYWQTTAELGYVGLALYLLIYATLFLSGLRYLARSRPGYTTAILIAALAGLAAQLTTAVGNPAWEFPECSLMLWILFALAAVTMGLGDRGREIPSSGHPVRRKRQRRVASSASAAEKPA